MAQEIGKKFLFPVTKFLLKVDFKNSSCTFTLLTKKKHPRYNIRMYWSNFWQLTVHVQLNISEKKTLMKVCRPHLYDSFGTSCVLIGQVFETQWAFEECSNIDKSLFSKENLADWRFWILTDLAEPRIIDQFGRESCKKKRKNVAYKIL